MADRDTEYVLVRNRKPKKTRQYYYDEDDDDDDDNDSRIYSRLVRRKPRKEQRIKYISSDEIDSDDRLQTSDVCVCLIELFKIISICLLSSLEYKFEKQPMVIELYLMKMIM
jgi:hypothetical protein